MSSLNVPGCHVLKGSCAVRSLSILVLCCSIVILASVSTSTSSHSQELLPEVRAQIAADFENQFASEKVRCATEVEKVWLRPPRGGSLLIQAPGPLESFNLLPDALSGLVGMDRHLVSEFFVRAVAAKAECLRSGILRSGLFSDVSVESVGGSRDSDEKRYSYILKMILKSKESFDFELVHVSSMNSTSYSLANLSEAEAGVAAFEKALKAVDRLANRVSGKVGASVANERRGRQQPSGFSETAPRYEMQGIQSSTGPISKIKLAVMDIEDKSGKLGTSVCERGTDYLRAMLTVARSFVVIDRGRQAEALKSLVVAEKKNSYKECYDQSCQIPLGQAVAADTILRTQVNMMANFCTLNSELVDLEKEAATGGGLVKFDCTEEGLSVAIEKILPQIAPRR